MGGKKAPIVVHRGDVSVCLPGERRWRKSKAQVGNDGMLLFFATEKERQPWCRINVARIERLCTEEAKNCVLEVYTARGIFRLRARCEADVHQWTFVLQLVASGAVEDFEDLLSCTPTVDRLGEFMCSDVEEEEESSDAASTSSAPSKSSSAPSSSSPSSSSSSSTSATPSASSTSSTSTSTSSASSQRTTRGPSASSPAPPSATNSGSAAPRPNGAQPGGGRKPDKASPAPAAAAAGAKVIGGGAENNSLQEEKGREEKAQEQKKATPASQQPQEEKAVQSDDDALRDRLLQSLLAPCTLFGRTGRLKAMQEWVSSKLPGDMVVEDIVSDFRDGTVLVRVAEAITGKEVEGSDMNPRHIAFKYRNINMAVCALREADVCIDVPAHEVVSGNTEAVMHLVWSIVYEYELKRIVHGPHRGLVALLRWCNDQAAPCSLSIDDFSHSFQDGTVLCALVHAYAPSEIDMSHIGSRNAAENTAAAVRAASALWHVPRWVEAGDVMQPPDPVLMAMYLSQFKMLVN
eukprot:TRINITY_DN2493_c3_g1_i1.p1 TRINITY_DN2493_c3_g1~~TRINITY_DN2493_c3_g1_i1.p1  ORF type:complete len:520 (+),score=199.52 TRINITY_DN2493_c3_g1_i1:322-1881(+)